jgi:cytidylate kinase
VAGVMKNIVIAIDGPAGTGKSSVTKRLAQTLGLTHIDTGAIYRCLALKVSRLGGIPAVDTPSIELLARSTQIEFRREPGKNPEQRVFLEHEDVTGLIRSPEISLLSSEVSALPGVRAALLDFQRNLAKRGPSVLEGRDIGTVVFPEAPLKFFLTASLDERAKRRLSELELSGADTPSYREIREQIRKRDEQDATRTVAPLRAAPDAIHLDTSSMTLDQVVEEMERIILRKFPEGFRG